MTYLLRGASVEMEGGGGCGVGGDGGGGCVHGVGEEKVMDNFAYSFAWVGQERKARVGKARVCSMQQA